MIQVIELTAFWHCSAALTTVQSQVDCTLRSVAECGVGRTLLELDALFAQPGGDRFAQAGFAGGAVAQRLQDGAEGTQVDVAQ